MVLRAVLGWNCCMAELCTVWWFDGIVCCAALELFRGYCAKLQLEQKCWSLSSICCYMNCQRLCRKVKLFILQAQHHQVHVDRIHA